MKFLPRLFFLALSNIRCTFQAPVVPLREGSPPRLPAQLLQAIETATMPLHELVNLRPKYTSANHEQLYNCHFSMHQDIKALNELEGDDLIKEIIKLRESLGKDAFAKRRFRIAIREYLKSRDVSEQDRQNMEDQFDLQNRQQANVTALENYRRNQTNGKRERLKKMKRKNEALRRFQRSMDFTPIGYFEQQMALYNIPPNSSIEEIEEKSRRFAYPSNRMATSHLKLYLKTRFSKVDVDRVVAKRSNVNRKQSNLSNLSTVRAQDKGSEGASQSGVQTMETTVEPYVILM